MFQIPEGGLTGRFRGYTLRELPYDSCRDRGVLISKIEILEKSQHADIGQDTRHQHPAFFTSIEFLQTKPCKVIHCNGDG